MESVFEKSQPEILTPPDEETLEIEEEEKKDRYPVFVLVNAIISVVSMI